LRTERLYYSPEWQLLEQRTWDTPAADRSQDGTPTAVAQQFWGARAVDDAVARRVDRDPAAADSCEDVQEPALDAGHRDAEHVDGRAPRVFRPDLRRRPSAGHRKLRFQKALRQSG
jgi:hypothetical protein